MAYVNYNPNPKGNKVDDCVIRALTLALGLNWDAAYVKLCLHGLQEANMPSINNVWGSFLIKNGYKRYILPNECPSCYTVKDFIADHPLGTYVLATGTHVITVIDGDYFDSWDSGDETPIYFFKKEPTNE